jgi:hypothetical protein
MTSEEQWKQIRGDYLNAIEKALCNASEAERKQILDDVSFHLNKRLAELPPQNQTRETMQQIITEMGPVEDYADLLEERAVPAKRRPSAIVYWIGGLIFLLVMVSFAPTCWRGWKESQKATRPVVKSTSPWPLATDVDPGTTEIKVTFDRSMMNFSWSWVGSGDHYPETTGEPRYDKDRLTCTLPVKLKPAQWYWVGINSEQFVYFQTEKHVPAKPYVILFATTDENGNPTQIPDDYIEEANRINSK